MMMQANQNVFLNESMIASNFQNFPPSDGVLSTMELSNILAGKTLIIHFSFYLIIYLFT